jgi:hypothetical protein
MCVFWRFNVSVSRPSGIAPGACSKAPQPRNALRVNVWTTGVVENAFSVLLNGFPR